MTVRSLTAAVVAVVAIAGCGGSAKTPTTTTATTTPASTPAASPSPTETATPSGLAMAALAKRANAICNHYADVAKQLGAPKISVPAKAARYFTAATRLARRQQAEFAALHPAAAVAARYKAFLSASADAVDLLGRLAQAAAAGDQARGAKLVQNLAPISARVDKTAHGIGASACATS
jgi:hypothetical protein